MNAKNEKKQDFSIIDDQPICTEKDDLFGREQFVKTLVNNIHFHCQTAHPCVVIALDGQWGEGKTSLLNRIHSLISKEISPKTNTPTKDDPIIQVRYNPWLCTNQESLLVDFFQHLLKGLKGDPFLKNKILTYAKRIMNPLSTLAGAIPIPGASAAVKAGFALGEELIDNALDEKSLCDLKKEIDETIGASNKHLIVYIDDLDRLDKEECHAVIKLIKQTADFKNTIYMVAMDMDHVAHSIENYYGRNEHSFGANYLQKIIQQPIRVPKFQKIHLSKYIEQKLFTEFITKIVETAEPSLQSLLENEAAKAKSKVLELTLPLIDTPRQVIQWINNLKFTLPNLLLTNEVNLTDFLLLSFLKVSFPDIYEKIRSEKWLLLTKKEGASNSPFTIRDEYTSEEIRELWEQYKKETRETFKKHVLTDFSENESKKEVMIQLLDNLLYDFFYDSKKSFLKNHKRNKHLCTEEHYDKYFIYDVPEGVIPEFEIQKLLSVLKEDTRILKYLNDLINNYGIRLAVSKFNEIKYYYQNKKVEREQIIKFLLALSQTQNSRKVKDYSDYLNHSLENFLSFTYDMIERLYPDGIDNNSAGKQTEDAFMSELVQKSAFMFLTVLLSRGLSEGMEYQQEVYRAMVPAWIERYKAERHKGDIKSIFEFDSTCSSDLLKAWKIYDEKEFEAYVEQQLYTNFENAKRFPYTHFNLSKIKENSRQPNYAIVDNFNVFFKDLLDLDRLSTFLKESLESNENALKTEEKQRINDFIRCANQYLKRKSS